LVPAKANPGPPGKIAITWRERDRQADRQTEKKISNEVFQDG